MTPGEEAAARVLALNRNRQADVAYTAEERAEIERLNIKEAYAVPRRYDSALFNLHLLQQDIAKERREISRRARRRAMAEGTDPQQRPPSAPSRPAKPRLAPDSRNGPDRRPWAPRVCPKYGLC